MVVYFDEGINRIWYRSIGFQIGLIITIQLWDVNLNKKPMEAFTELESGLYYLDYDFNQRGNWVALVYENGIKIASQTFAVGMSRPGIVTFRRRKK